MTMLNHDDSTNVGEDDLHALIDGRLAPDRHHDVMGYLSVHEEAAERVNVFMRQRVQLAALRERLVDAQPTRDIEDLAQALGARVQRHRRLRRTFGASAIALATAAGLVLAVGLPDGAGIDSTRVKVATAPPPPRDLIAEANQVGLADSDAPLLRLQASLSGEAFRKPDLERFGLRFVGSSPMSTAAAPAVRMAYADEQGRPFHLFMGAHASGIGLAASFVPPDHIALSWISGPLVVTLIAPKDSPQLAEIIGATATIVGPEPIAADAGIAADAAIASPAVVETGPQPPTEAVPEAMPPPPPGDPAGSKQL